MPRISFLPSLLSLPALLGASAPAEWFVKVVLNCEVLHENVEVGGPTRSAAFHDEAPQGPLLIQGDHGPAAFRAIALREVVLP